MSTIPLTGFSWFGLVVYFVVMGFIIKGINIPIPLFISRPLLVVAATLRLVDPPCPRRRLKGAAETTTTPPVLEGLEEPQLPSRVATRSSLRSGVSRRKSFEVRNLGGVQRQGEEALSRSATATGTSDLGIVGEGDNEVVGDGVRPSLRSRSESKIGLSSREESIAGKSRNEADEDGNENAEERRLSFPLDLRTAPVVGVILLLITTTIDGSVLRLGIVGEDGVQPYDVLVLFISLAYISTALDSTGALRALAFWIAQTAAKVPKSGSTKGVKVASGPKLYVLLYSFWFFFGVVVGNDPIILSGTAFLGYFTKATGISDPTAWTFSQFISANIASAVLVPSNPTNVLIAGAFGLNFLTGYTAYTILPSVITALVALPLTFFTFTFFRPKENHDEISHAGKRMYIPKHLLPPDINPRSALLDKNGAVFHTTLMGITLALLVGTSFVPEEKVQVWMVTAPAGILAVLRDLFSERAVGSQLKEVRSKKAVDEIELETPEEQAQIKDELGSLPLASPSAATPLQRERTISLPSSVRWFIRNFPMTSSTISRLPLSLLPFAGGIFVLARALTSLGWTSIFAGWLASVSVNPAASIFFLGYLTTLVMCPLCGTNIGATILLVEILRDANFSSAPHVLADPRIFKGAIFSVALASNLGAFSWTISSSLAGLLWSTILLQKGIKVGFREFAGWNMLFLPALSTVASGFILFEVVYFGAI